MLALEFCRPGTGNCKLSPPRCPRSACSVYLHVHPALENHALAPSDSVGVLMAYRLPAHAHRRSAFQPQVVHLAYSSLKTCQCNVFSPPSLPPSNPTLSGLTERYLHPRPCCVFYLRPGRPPDSRPPEAAACGAQSPFHAMRSPPALGGATPIPRLIARRKPLVRSGLSGML